MKPYTLAALALCLASAGSASGQASGTRFAERLPLPRSPVEHTMERAGNADSVARYARPTSDRNTAGGYIGGTRLIGNGLFARGSAAPAGATVHGTDGTDYTGLRGLAGRVFLRESADPSRGTDAARKYRTEGPQVPDAFNLRPLRNAKLEKDADLGKRSGKE